MMIPDKTTAAQLKSKGKLSKSEKGLSQKDGPFLMPVIFLKAIFFLGKDFFTTVFLCFKESFILF